MSEVPIVYGRDPRYVVQPDVLLSRGGKKAGASAAARPSPYEVVASASAGVEAGDGSEYIKFVKKYHKAHPDLSWKQAMKKASKSYHKLDCAKKLAKAKASKKAGKMKPFTALMGLGEDAGVVAAGEVVQPYIRDAKEDRDQIIAKVKQEAMAGSLEGGSILGSIGDAIGSIFGLGEEAGMAAGVAASASAGELVGGKKKKKKAGVSAAEHKEAGVEAGNILGDIGRAVGSIFGFGEDAVAAGMMDPRMMRPELIVAAMDHSIYDKALKGGVLSAGEAKYAKKKRDAIRKGLLGE